MIILSNLTKYIITEPLFKDLSLILQPDDKIGLVGPNGCGKSTLLKIIVGEVEADEGYVEVLKEKIGYLPQEIGFNDALTIRQYLGNDRKITETMNEVGLGISLDSTITELSGGQKTKLGLAKVLLKGPTFLLLDEPTNHLDDDGLVWLENFIRNFNGGVLVVSHDRHILNNTVNKIVEIDSANHKVNEYSGNYNSYVKEKAKQTEIWENQFQLQQREKKRLENWLVLKKQEATAHPDPAKGRKIRSMEKRLQREILNKEMARPKDYKTMNGLNLSGQVHTGKLIIRLKNISKSYNCLTLIKNINFELRGATRTLLAGKNGSGKTTLLKIILGQINPDGGEIKIGDNVKIGYFAQEHEILSPNNTVIEEFLATERLQINSTPRSILGAFLFTGEDINKKVSDLSLGERVRLIFAKLTHQQNELLVLDEPTNHLDIASRDIIEAALLDYKGAVLVVSHDRYFLSKIAINVVVNLKDGVLTETLV